MRAAMRWLGTASLALACAARGAAAADLVEVWQAAAQNDKEHAVGRAAHAMAQPRRDQASALWRPHVGFTASAGVATRTSEARGAQFSAPGLGQSTGVDFNTSVTGGRSGRWAIEATQPLYNPARRAQQRQLDLSAEQVELEWQAAVQALMLRTAERYFDVALAEEAVRVLQRQLDAVQRAATEADDRFALGSAPITDTHEARARLHGIRSQVLAAQSDLRIKRALLADSTGWPPGALAARLPAATTAAAKVGPLDPWLRQAQSGNPVIRSQALAGEAARQEAARYSLRSSAAVELVAQAGHDRLSGSGGFGTASNSGAYRALGIQLTVPLFSGGQREAKEEEALRLADKAEAELGRTRQQVAQQVHAAWLGLSVGEERVLALGEALAATLARLDATRIGHEVGQRTTLELLNAESDSASASLALAQARVALLLDRLRLAALAGGLDETDLHSVNAELAPPQP
jgi:outer membrane protein